MQIDLGGRTLTYDDVGAGPPVLLLPQPLLGPAIWRPQLADLTQKYRTLVPELPARPPDGTPGEGPSLAGMVEDLEALLAAANVRESVVVGAHGPTGYLALLLARKSPARIRGLVLVSTAAGVNLNQETRLLLERQIAFLQQSSLQTALEFILPRLLSQPAMQRPELLLELRRLAAARPTQAACALLQALHEAPDWQPLPARANFPSLLLMGEHDAMIPPAAMDKLARALPNVQLVRLPGAGHLANWEQPERVNEAVLAFLDQLTAKDGG
jgi:pimeloyl-ACP methyl ester carboxylesterase